MRGAPITIGRGKVLGSETLSGLGNQASASSSKTWKQVMIKSNVM